MSDEIILEWQPVGQLPADAFYEVVVTYAPVTAPTESWQDETPWTKESRWTLSEHAYLPGLAANGDLRWSVRVMQATGKDAYGRSTGVQLSPMSSVRSLKWHISGSGSSETGPKETAPP
jgi:hypothetical protein